MELKQLIINNFLSYFPKTTFDFASTTTVILGQNNTGKSKLFDAINWSIYERVYDTLKEKWVTDITEIANLILNKKAIIEGLKNNTSVLKTTSELTIEDGAELIKINREYSYNLNEGSYKLSNSKLLITIQDVIDNKPQFLEGADANGYLAQKFSKNIQDFFLFQGESGSRILKLQKGNFFRVAVRDIARLKIFEDALSFAQRFEESARLKITKQTNKNKKAKEEIDVLELTVSRLEKEYDDAKIELDNCLDTKTKCQDEFNDVSSKLDKYKEFENFLRDKEALEKNREDIERQHKNAESIKSTISEDAVFYKVLDKISSFKDFYSTLQ